MFRCAGMLLWIALIVPPEALAQLSAARIREGCGQDAVITGAERLSVMAADCPIELQPGSILTVREESGPIEYIHLRTSNLDMAEPSDEVRFDLDCYTINDSKTCQTDPAKAVAANGKWFNVPEGKLRRASQDSRPASRRQTLLSKALRLETEPARFAELIDTYEEINRELPASDFIQRRISWLKDQRDAGVQDSIAEKRTFGVSIGISDHAWLSEEWQLAYASADAELFHDYLVHPLGAGVEPTNAVLLTDEQATSAAIRHHTEDVLLRQAGAGDTVYLFFSGHGLAERRNWSSFVVAHDSLPSEPKTLYRMGDLLAAISEAVHKGVTVLLFADMCHAGAVADNWIHEQAELTSNEGRFLAVMASQGDQFSWEIKDIVAPGHGHGAFTHDLVVRGLAGEAARDGKVRASEIGAFLENEIPKTVRERIGRRQQPRVFGRLTEDVVLARPPLKPADDSMPMRAVNFDRRSHEPLRKGAARLNIRRIRGSVEELMAEKTVPFGEEWRKRRDDLAARLEAQGQEVLLRYLTGDELAPEKEDFELCAESFEGAAELNPWAADLDVRAYFCRGRARLFDLDQRSNSSERDETFRESLALFDRALNLDPIAGYIYNAIGVAYLENAAFEQAARYFDNAILLNPHWAYPRHNLALTRIEQGRYDEAMKQYRRAVAAADHYGLAYGYLHYSLGLLYQRLGRHPEAEQEYERAASLFRSKGENFARLSSRLPDGPRSVWARARSTDFSKHEAKTYNALGSLLEVSGRPKKARPMYERSLALDSTLAPALHNLGLWLESRGDTQEAVEVWRKNQQVNPGFLPSVRSLALAYESKGASLSGDEADEAYARALEHYQELTELDPGYSEGQLGLARALLALNKAQQALTAAKKAVELQPGDPRSLKTLGDALRSTGAREEAVRRYEEALDYAPEPHLKKQIEAALRQTGRRSTR